MVPTLGWISLEAQAHGETSCLKEGLNIRPPGKLASMLVTAPPEVLRVKLRSFIPECKNLEVLTFSIQDFYSRILRPGNDVNKAVKILNAERITYF